MSKKKQKPTKHVKSAEVRQTFLDFFAKRGHQVVPASSLVPGSDPTLLFTNAGMVQFKDVFLGLDSRPYKMAVTAQKCMRISGKHNDLENVGPSPYHHTFFEMLGNFSFGEYFKREAIHYAYELLTQVYGLPPDRLYFTVFQDDDEAFGIWVDEVGVPAERVYRMGHKTNFWQMADTGPCGPTSEIHYDWGPEACTCGQPDCSVLLDNGCERWLELWNLVFMQFNRDEDGNDHPLPKPGVDTGLGLERIVTVLQDTAVDYDTDLFTDIMDAAQSILGHDGAFREEHYVAYRVIADHTRAVTFLIADGVNPGPTGREYITRMLIRRAWRFAHSMGVREPFLAQVAQAVVEKMGDFYPELRRFQEAVDYQISAEESRFVRTLDYALSVLDAEIEAMQESGQKEMPGDKAFFLYATHGLPFEITRDVLKERGLAVEEAGFHEAMRRHREADQEEGEWVFADVSRYQTLLDELKREGALGDGGVVNDPYGEPRRDVRVLALLKEGERASKVSAGDHVEVVLSETPFYVASGGQVSDTGQVTGARWIIHVEDVRMPVGGLIVHIGKVAVGEPQEGDEAVIRVDMDRRWDVMRHHTATHLLHAALRKVLGEHVRQKGSLVAPDRLRFDFTHNAYLTQDELDAVTAEVNAVILADLPVEVTFKPLEEATREGAMALFGEKYGATVRTISIDEVENRFSYELCGGTHVASTAEIGPFVIISEGASAAGVRRIVAVAGRAAQALIQHRLKTLDAAAVHLGADPDQIDRRVLHLVGELQAAQHTAEDLRQQLAQIELERLLDSAQDVKGVAVLAAVVDAPDRDILGQMTDWYRERIKSGVVVLGSVVEERVLLAAAITPDLVKRGLHAGELIRTVASMVDGGGGGGNPQFATGGGKDASRLEKALASVVDVVASALG
jgi:alanyl-tRNA synthetase